MRERFTKIVKLVFKHFYKNFRISFLFVKAIRNIPSSVYHMLYKRNNFSIFNFSFDIDRISVLKEILFHQQVG